MIARSANIPLFYCIGEGTSLQTKDLLARENLLFRRPLIVSGTGFTGSVARTVAQTWQSEGLRVEVASIQEASVEAAEDVTTRVLASQIDLVMAVGGGKAIDVGKYVSAETRRPCVVVPTTLSSDGIASPVAVLKKGGRTGSYPAAVPLGIVVDTTIVAGAPKPSLLAGIGDLLANIEAIKDWELAEDAGFERRDALAEVLAEMSVTVAMGELRTIRDEIPSSTLYRLAEALISSGLAMSLAGSSRPCSGAEHLISHALAETGYTGLHGYTVALAGLFTAELRSPLSAGPRKQLMSTAGMPISPAQMGIDETQFMSAVARAPETRPNRFTILNLRKDPDEHRMAYARAFGE